MRAHPILVPLVPWLLVAAACAAEVGPERGASVQRVPLAEGADPTLRFGADWSVQLEGDRRQALLPHLGAGGDRPGRSRAVA